MSSIELPDWNVSVLSSEPPPGPEVFPGPAGEPLSLNVAQEREHERCTAVRASVFDWCEALKKKKPGSNTVSELLRAIEAPAVVRDWIRVIVPILNRRHPRPGPNLPKPVPYLVRGFFDLLFATKAWYESTTMGHGATPTTEEQNQFELDDLETPRFPPPTIDVGGEEVELTEPLRALKVLTQALESVSPAEVRQALTNYFQFLSARQNLAKAESQRGPRAGGGEHERSQYEDFQDPEHKQTFGKELRHLLGRLDSQLVLEDNTPVRLYVQKGRSAVGFFHFKTTDYETFSTPTYFPLATVERIAT